MSVATQTEELTRPRSNPLPTAGFISVCGLFVYSFLFKFPLTPFLRDADQSIFIYEAERMLNGDVMYRDFFQFTFPGTQAFYAGLFSIFGVRYWIVAVVTLVIALVTAWLMVKIAERFLPSPLTYFPALLYIFFGFRWFGLDGSHRMFSPIFVLLAILLLMRSRSVLSLIATGVCLGLCSFFTQQRGFVVFAAIVAFLFVERIYESNSWSVFLKRSAIIGTSFAASLILLMAPFVVAAGFETFFAAAFVYPAKYYSYGHPNSFGIFFIDLQKAFTVTNIPDIIELGPVVFHDFVVPLASPVVLLWFLFKRRLLDWQIWQYPVLVALVGMFLTLSTTAPNQFRLFQISGPSLIALVWLFQRAIDSKAIKNKIMAAVSAVVLLLAAAQAIRVQTYWQTVPLDTPSGHVAAIESPLSRRYEWLLKNTKPGDYIFEVYEPFVYLPLGLKNPTRFGQIWPNGYTRPEQIEEVIRDLTARPPQFILWDNAYLPTGNPREEGDHTGPLADFVHANYRPVGEIYEMDGRPVQVWEKIE